MGPIRVTVAHAARNTQVPFMVLKDRVVNRNQSLAEAIHEFKPDLDAKADVKRARVEALSDLDIANWHSGRTGGPPGRSSRRTPQ